MRLAVISSLIHTLRLMQSFNTKLKVRIQKEADKRKRYTLMKSLLLKNIATLTVRSMLSSLLKKFQLSTKESNTKLMLVSMVMTNVAAEPSPP